MSYNLSKIDDTFDFRMEIGICVPLPLNPLHEMPIFDSKPRIFK